MNTSRDDNAINSAQFAVLVERVEEMIRQITGVNASVSALTKAQQDSIVETKLLQHNIMGIKADNEALTERQSKIEEKLNRVAQTVSIHANIWKLIGSGAVMSVGLLGWLYSSISEIKTVASNVDKRLTVAEYAIKQAEAPRYQPQPTSTGGK